MCKSNVIVENTKQLFASGTDPGMLLVPVPMFCMVPAGNPECCFGYMGANVRGQGRMCVPYVARMVEEPEVAVAARKLLSAI